MFKLLHYVLCIIILCSLSAFNIFMAITNQNSWLVPGYNNNVRNLENINETYDFIIVGAGSAGCVVAHNLAINNSAKVLLIEAGPLGNRLLDVPAAIPLLQQSIVDWKYRTEIQKDAAKSMHEQKSMWPRGKIVGGTGRLNNMIYIRGHPEDYRDWFPNEWEVMSFEDKEKFLKYYWKKSENQIGSYANDTVWHGQGGPLIANDIQFKTKLGYLFAKSAEEFGIPKRDLNTHYTGFDFPQVNVKQGARYSTAHFLLERLGRINNLHLVTHTLVNKINFIHSYEANSINAYSNTSRYVIERKIFARHGIIISAGVIGTPKLLQLSGVGDSDKLASMGILPLIPLPDVGKNLKDHVGIGIDSMILDELLELNAYNFLNPIHMYDYIINGAGPYTTVQCEGIIIGHSKCLLKEINELRNCELAYKYLQPDIQFMLIPLGMTADYGAFLHNILGVNETIYKNYYEALHGKATAMIMPSILHPKSSGYVHIKSGDPFEDPIIDPQYLSHPDDIETILKGVRIMQKFVQSNALRPVGARLDNRPFPRCINHKYDSDDYWKCYIQHMTLTVYHPVGTAAIGKVLKYDFSVRHTNKLYVADASALPDLISGNPNAAIVLAAELASNHILDNLRLSKQTCENLCLRTILRPTCYK